MDEFSADRFLQAAGGDGPIRIFVESQATNSGKLHSFQQPYILVGRHDRADLQLSDPEIARRQLYEQMVGGRLFVVNLSDRVRARWDNEPQSSGWVDEQQVISVGPFTLRFTGGAKRPGTLERRRISPLASSSY